MIIVNGNKSVVVGGSPEVLTLKWRTLENLLDRTSLVSAAKGHWLWLLASLILALSIQTAEKRTILDQLIGGGVATWN